MQVILSPLAKKNLKKIHSLDQIIIYKKLRSLEDKYEHAGVKKLKGYKLFRLRVGKYRIVYERTAAKVYVPIIAHRREVYNLLKRMF
ncbi:MAG: type II toxin-antitoxin system RelE/ParE family toxin [Patescibacteria group bacterium]|nr:type II toxin-antitoxin system RelE/ParE family toxin [Patescibacteria group bacterium]